MQMIIKTKGGKTFDYQGSLTFNVGDIFPYNNETVTEIVAFASGTPCHTPALTEAGKYLQARRNWWEEHSRNEARHWCAKKDRF